MRKENIDETIAKIHRRLQEKWKIDKDLFGMPQVQDTIEYSIEEGKSQQKKEFENLIKLLKEFISDEETEWCDMQDKFLIDSEKLNNKLDDLIKQLEKT